MQTKTYQQTGALDYGLALSPSVKRARTNLNSISIHGLLLQKNLRTHKIK